MARRTIFVVPDGWVNLKKKRKKKKSENSSRQKSPKRLFLHKDRSLFCDVLQSPINLALETDQRQTRQSSDLSSNQTFDLTIPRLLQQMSYGLRLFCLQETTQNSSMDLDCQNLMLYFEETNAGKTDAGFSIPCSSKMQLPLADGTG